MKPMQRPLFRPTPVLPPGAMQTYALTRPKKTHTRIAICKEVDCGNYKYGWKTIIDVGTALGAKQANYIRLHSGRHFQFDQSGTVVTFTFQSGQQCFREHRVRIDREPLYLKFGGDWRQTASAPTRMNSADWVDDFATHQQRISDKKQEG
jgi:hypothetical protein